MGRVFHESKNEFDTNEDYENACKWVEDGSIKQFLNM